MIKNFEMEIEIYYHLIAKSKKTLQITRNLFLVTFEIYLMDFMELIHNKFMEHKA